MTPITASLRTASGRADRTTTLTQTMVGAAVIIATLIAMLAGSIAVATPLMLGLLLVFAATGIALLSRTVNRLLGAVLAGIDIFAILLLSLAAPNAGFPLLWMFLAIWVGFSYGLAGVLSGTALIGASYITFVVVTVTAPDPSRAIILPVVVAGLASVSAVVASRDAAQRVLLEQQSRELARALERAQRQEDMVTQVLDAVDFGVARLTPAGELIMVNEAHEQLARLGIGSAPAYADDGITPLAAEQLPLARARAGEDIPTSLVWFGAPGDVERQAVRFTTQRVRELDGSTGGRIVVAQDVTAEQLALRSREDLISSVSHELRTPLTSITGYVELVLDGEGVDADARRSLEIVDRSADRLLTLVSDLLSATSDSKVGVQLSFAPEPVDVRALVDAAVEAAMPGASERGMRIDVTGEAGIRVVADPHRLRQVLDNLISNAIKYGRTDGRIEVSLAARSEHALVIVADDGAGIPANEVPHLFDRFFRSALVRRSGTHGTGLGLSISRDIVRAHRGELYAHSALGVGSEFTVLLPLEPVETQAGDAR